MSSTSVYVSWNAVPAIDQNGVITEYDIEYSPTFPQLSYSMTMTENMSVTLNGLEEYTVYIVRVRAHTIIGAGPYSTPQSNRTMEDGKFIIAYLIPLLSLMFLYFI